MDSLILEKIKELLANNENIGIAVGKNPGIDENGRCFVSIPRVF